MGEVTSGVSDLLPKIASLFNNKKFSDVEFVFPGSVLYGHQLIIALRSDYFASIFYQNEKPVQKIKLPEEQRKLYYCLLRSTLTYGQIPLQQLDLKSKIHEEGNRFLYTDEIEFEGVDMEDLYAISNQYGIKDLASKCLKYLVEERITIDNIFSKYKCALSKNIETMLRECRNFVCHNSELVFQAFSLENAQSEILEDILKQDDLSLSSELIAINAVLRWSKNRCKEDELPVNDKNLRECIFPFLKYLRFLTLSATEFQRIVEKYDIFNGIESTLLTCKILQPQSDVNVPEYICQSNLKRGKLISNTASPPLFSKGKYIIPEHRKYSASENRMKSDLEYKEPSGSQYQIKNNSQNNLSYVSNYMEICKKSSSVEKSLIDIPRRPDPNFLDISEWENNMTSSMKSENDKLLHAKLGKQSDASNKAKLHQLSLEKPINVSNKAISYQSSLEKSRNLSSNPKLPQSSFQYEIKKTTPFAGNNASPTQYKGSRGQSSPNISFSNLAVSNNNRRTFEFCLIERPNSLLHSFRRDIKCSVTFMMKSGSVKLYGFELYVKNESEKCEELKVDVDLKGFSGSFSSEIFKKCPVNNVFSVMLKNPMLLHEMRKGEVEISIDSLYLNRCLVCPSAHTVCELNNGSNCMCDVSIKSNQYAENQDGIYFLINRLFYSPC